MCVCVRVCRSLPSVGLRSRAESARLAEVASGTAGRRGGRSSLSDQNDEGYQEQSRNHVVARENWETVKKVRAQSDFGKKQR